MYITETNTFKKTVKVRIPLADRPDAKRDFSIVCEFETMSREELEEFVARQGSVRELLDRVLKGVEGCKDRDGQDLAADKGAEACIKNTIVSVAIRDAYWEATQGAKK